MMPPANPPPVFLDTGYVYALVNTRDQWHEQAVAWQQRIVAARRALVTTELICVEIADGLAAVRFRAQAARIVSALEDSPLVEVVPVSKELLESAFELYRQHDDKDWGLTDCASFVVMHERGLSEALTTDGHYTQAGFDALLRNQ